MECLLKAADVRPKASSLKSRLGVILNPSSLSASKLQAANEAEVQRMAREVSAQSAERSVAERQREMFASAEQALGFVAERLYSAIRDNAPLVQGQLDARKGFLNFSLHLGSATLSFSAAEQSTDVAWGYWRPSWQVIAYASVAVHVPPDRYDYRGRSHSLWFCDAQKAGVFGWYETAFMVSAFIPERATQNPFALPPGEQAGKALSPALTEFQVAWPFTAIDAHDVEFLERWMAWFAQGAQGQLTNPSRMPERQAEGTWRR